MKRFTIIEKSDGQGNGWMEIRKNPEGEFVEYSSVENEVDRLKIKCNQYAKRLVLLGEDDVSWEASDKFLNQSTAEN